MATVDGAVIARSLLRGLILTAAMLALPMSAAAQAVAVAVEREVQYFLVSGTTLAEIRKELDDKGPRGFWALTEWHVGWSKSCEVTYRVRITLPRLIFRNKLSPSDRVLVEQMLMVLRNHEENHARMGLFAAEEVKRNGCRNASEIIDYWQMKNTQYDRQTANGRREGVRLD